MGRISADPAIRAPLALLLAMAAAGLHACGGSSTGVDRGDEIASVTVTPASVEIDLGEPVQLTASVVNRRGESVGSDGVDWSSNDGSVATVDDSGLVTGVGEGSALITATLEGVSGQATVDVVVQPLEITTGSLSQALVGTEYNESVLARGGDGQYGWSLAGGSLPPGLALSDEDPVDGGPTEAVISGAPEEEGTFTFTVEVVDGRGETASRQLSIEVVQVTEVSIATLRLQPGLVGAPYGGTLRAEGGDEENYEWRVVGGALPPGLALDPDGSFSGSPSTTGTSTFTVEVTSAGRTDTAEFTIEVVPHDQSRYNITAVEITSPADVVQSGVEAAMERWEAVLVGNLPATIQGDLSPESCGGFGRLVSGVAVDDIVLLVNIDEIDGSGGTLGFAGPCGFVRNDGLPLTGILTLDEADLLDMAGTSGGRELMEDVIFHEIGHVLGFGTLWRFDPFFDLVVGADTNNPVYVGDRAVEEYADLGGSGDVPVENDGGERTRLGHWEEDGEGTNDMRYDPVSGRQGLDSEIMTGFAEPAGHDRPLSRVTIGSMEDLGYGVSYAPADPFVLPSAPAATIAADDEDGVAFGDDMLLEPLYVRMPDGSVRVIRPGR